MQSRTEPPSVRLEVSRWSGPSFAVLLGYSFSAEAIHDYTICIYTPSWPSRRLQLLGDIALKKKLLHCLDGGSWRSRTASERTVGDYLISAPYPPLLLFLPHLPAAGCCRLIFSSSPSSSSVVSFLQSTPLSRTTLACQAHAMTSKFPGPVRPSSPLQINLPLTSQNRWPGPFRAYFSSSTCFRPMLPSKMLLRSPFFPSGLWNTKDLQDP